MRVADHRFDAERVIVTGAAGFIGSHAVEAFCAAGAAAVLGIDNFDTFYDRETKLRNAGACEAAATEAGAEFGLAEFDVADEGETRRQFARFRPTLVVHLAAKAGVRPSIEDPVGYCRANLVATASVLRAATEAGASRVVAASSSSVYGDSTEPPFSEEAPALDPISPYAATKRSCELLGRTHHHLTGTPVAMLRYFTVYGPRQRPDLAIAKFLARVAAGEPIEMFGDGSTSRDYTFVADVVAGTLAACARVAAHGFRVWNLGSDRPTRLDELISSVGRTVGREPVVRPVLIPPGDVQRTWADLTRSRAELGYEPRTSLEDGLAAQWAWMSREAAAARADGR